MADRILNLTDSQGTTPVRASCTVLLEMSGPEIFENSPFRILGLPVLAGARDVAKRVDELKLAEEFGAGAPEWSFAPKQALTVEQIRSAAQALKEPASRLVQELFWFWPANFPEDDSAGDQALAHLKRGETDHAVELWHGAAKDGHLAALHNMAVYYHLRALEMEQQESPPEETLIQLWFKALRYWERIGGDEALWTRLRDRIKVMADARVTDDFATQLQMTLVEALAKVCAMLALKHAQEGRTTRATLHAALVTHIHGDTLGARRAMEEYAGPTAKRIEARSIEAEKRIVQQPADGQSEAIALLQHCDADLYLIELLCGRTTDFFVEVSHGLVDTALDCVVGYQRETFDDFGCLPVLLRLLDMEASPELKARVAQTFEAVYRNALSGGSRPPIALVGSEKEPELDHARTFQLIVSEIVPGLEKLGMGAGAKRSYAERAAVLLKNLAIEAGMQRDDLELTARVFETACALPVSDELRESLKTDQVQLERECAERKAKELVVEGAGCRLVVNRHGIGLNDNWVPASEIAGVRYGVVISPETGESSRVIAWRSVNGEAFEVNGTNLLPSSEYLAEHFGRILDSIHYFIVPRLIERLVAGIRAGQEIYLGATRLHAGGLMLPGPSVHFWKKDELISYVRLETVVDGGRLIVSNKDNSRQTEAHDVVSVWNAAVFGHVVEELARE